MATPSPRRRSPIPLRNEGAARRRDQALAATETLGVRTGPPTAAVAVDGPVGHLPVRDVGDAPQPDVKPAAERTRSRVVIVLATQGVLMTALNASLVAGLLLVVLVYMGLLDLIKVRLFRSLALQ